MSILLSLHVLAAVIWVGGMFFAYVVLRPNAALLLEPPARLRLWAGCFQGFFIWVWLAVIALPASGYWLMFRLFQGMGSSPLYVHLMHGLGLLMIVLYLYLFFRPYPQLRAAVAAADWPAGGRHLAIIRHIVGTNLLLGLLTISIAAGGRWLLV